MPEEVLTPEEVEEILQEVNKRLGEGTNMPQNPSK